MTEEGETWNTVDGKRKETSVRKFVFAGQVPEPADEEPLSETLRANVEGTWRDVDRALDRYSASVAGAHAAMREAAVAYYVFLNFCLFFLNLLVNFGKI